MPLSRLASSGNTIIIICTVIITYFDLCIALQSTLYKYDYIILLARVGVYLRFGLRSFRRNDAVVAQKMMRGRVAAQVAFPTISFTHSSIHS